MKQEKGPAIGCSTDWEICSHQKKSCIFSIIIIIIIIIKWTRGKNFIVTLQDSLEKQYIRTKNFIIINKRGKIMMK